jgi:hypothetical protein
VSKIPSNLLVKGEMEENPKSKNPKLMMRRSKP